MQNFKTFLFDILEYKSKTRLGILFEYFFLWIIFLNVFFVILETLPEFKIQEFHLFFLSFEIFSIVVFTIEYLLRLWVCPFHMLYSGRFGRIKYILSPLMIFDLLVLLSFFFLFFPFGDPRVFRIFRVMRIFRLLRSQYSIAEEHILQVLKQRKNELIAVFGRCEGIGV